MEVSLNYTFDEDGLIRLQKDLNHLLNNLNDQNIKSLKTEYVDISSKGGETIIDGSLIEMYDWDIATSKATTTLRLRMGYNKTSSNFEFNLWNSISTTPTLTLDSIGNAVFSGSVNTSDAMYVGNNIFLGQTGSTLTKGLYFNATTPTTAEAENTPDMKTALYITSSNLGIQVNINSTGIIDMSALNTIYLGHNITTGMSVSTSNFLTNYKPLLVLGDETRHTVFLGARFQYEPTGAYYASSSLVEGQGYINNAYWKMSDVIHGWWGYSGKIMDEFASTVGWTPNILGYIDGTVSSSNARCIGNNGLTLVNNTTSSGDLTMEKMYSNFAAIWSNGTKYMSTDMMFYTLFYLYDLTRINTLSTKAYQVELASSSGGTDKRRWLLGGTTTLSTLTTGWNVTLQKVDSDYYQDTGVFDMASLKFARISFEVKANSTGRIATMQSLGFVRRSSAGSTTPVIAGMWDNNYGGMRKFINTVSGKPSWMPRRSGTTDVVFQPFGALAGTESSGIMFPTVSYNYGENYPQFNRITGNCRVQFKVKIKNDKGRIPLLGLYLDENSDSTDAGGQCGIYATSNTIYLEQTYNSTTVTDNTGIFTLAYNDEFIINLWKEDTHMYAPTQNAQLSASIQKVGTTQVTTLSGTWQKCIWKRARFVPFVTSKEVDSGIELQDITVTRR
jgi:hypothetical protein